MPTLVSRSSSSGADAHAHPQAPSLSSLASQAAAIQHVRNRFMTAVRSPAVDLDQHRSVSVLDEDDDNMDALSSASSAPSPSPVDTLETEFAAAVIFVDTYQGPHRILKQDNSTPKKEFYALYQQATVGACPLATPPPSLSKLELARWEKWRALGHMPRHEAMQRYTAALDNLVDDWRRSAGLVRPQLNLSSSVISTTSSNGGGGVLGVPGSPLPSYPRAKKNINVFERLPRIYDEFGELQERVEEETRKREELEAQLVAFTRDNRALFSREIRQVDTMRTNLTQLVQSLEEDVAQHYNELQQSLQRQQQLQSLVDGSVLLRVESRARQVVAIISFWAGHKTVRRVLLVLFAFRVWNFLRQRRMPQMFAQLLIRWLTNVSSLENGGSAPRAAVIVRR